MQSSHPHLRDQPRQADPPLRRAVQAVGGQARRDGRDRVRPRHAPRIHRRRRSPRPRSSAPTSTSSASTRCPGWTRVGVPTIGQCKGTLEAVCAADMVVIFHVPLFSRWLKTVIDGGTRVLMIIDAPDALAQLMSPPGPQGGLQVRRVDLPADQEGAGHQRRAAPTSPGSCGEYPVMTQWGYADERGHFDHWGAGHIHTFPNEGSARRHRRIRSRATSSSFPTAATSSMRSS